MAGLISTIFSMQENREISRVCIEEEANKVVNDSKGLLLHGHSMYGKPFSLLHRNDNDHCLINH
ncbi:MAG: hypothetical protein D6816_11555 [Bacteroidetes bacterium]|nr:MAG: hypothetical protein D6816_11555 [Bacteroidota bacterium]